jgi:3-hydroxyisobutyrate dehydrogenase/2-hydroxy-3-oxopropionate reductase
VATVAFIGLGSMGERIAERLVDAGYDVTVWNRTPAKADALVARGARLAATPAAAASGADFAITMVANPDALRDVTEGPDGVAAGAGADTVVIEMSTSGPAAVARLASVLNPATPFVDAPVLGSLPEAESGTLTIFVGGDDDVVERCTPLLEHLGTPMHVGGLGAGAAAKLVANSTLIAVIAALGEALALADALGLERDVAFQVLGTTALASQAERRREAIESGDFPPRFKLELALKDAGLVEEAAEAAGVELRVAAAARTWLADAERAGLGDRDYAAVLAEILGQA